MELAHLFESEETDRASRLEAVMVFSKIKDWLTSNIENLDRRLQSVSSGNFKGGYVLSSAKVNLDGDYPDLYVIFMPKGEVQISANGDRYQPKAGLALSPDGKKFIVLRCLRAPFDFQYLDTRFGAQKWNFLHEFMHYLMRHRTGLDSGSVDSAKQSLGDYYNNPDETNAFYQEMAQSITDIVRSVSEASKEKANEFYHMSTPALAMRLKAMCADRDMLVHLKPEKARAFDKRLVRFIDQTIKPMLARALGLDKGSG